MNEFKNRFSRQVQYHLRFQVIPGKNVERDAHVLANFCRKHGVEEVVMFFAGEEWNNGLLSAKEENMWFNTVKKVKYILNKSGVKTSLNPWMTVLHCDRGRRFPKDRKFKPMVSPDGEVSKACASFADPEWRKYICRVYGRFAKLGFRVIWVEDDFRYHNHDPLTWGGGFEPEVLNRFERKIGRRITRKEVVKNILKPGEPHPWRAMWMENWREIQIETAGDITKVVAGDAPDKTKIGLMSSLPSTQSAEGRDWQKLFDVLTINGQVAHRPHFAGYSESLGKDKVYSVMMLDIQKNFRPDYCEVAPEVENFPYTNWAKSDSMTWTDMALCMFYGSDALLLNLFPFSGNPAGDEPQIGKLLDKSCPGLEWISKKFSKNLQTCGVGIPWRQDAQAYVRTTKGQSMTELNASSLTPGEYLLPYGIPVSADCQEVNAVFGSLAWAFDNDEIYNMLSKGLLLDGLSADILCQRGFGRYIGVNFKKWVNREEGKYSVEIIVSNKTGIRKGVYLSANLLDRMGKIEPRKGADEWTTIITPERERFGAGMVVYENELGGRVVTHPMENPAVLPRSYQRQTIVQKAINFLAGGRFNSIMVTGGANLIPIHFKGEDKHFVVVFNGSPDSARPVIQMHNLKIKNIQSTLLAPLSKPARAKMGAEVPYLGFLVLEISIKT